MSDLGVLLQNAREKRGLSLDDIQETTKIRKRYLEAIESGDHTVLPGPFYVRAFVKNYSEAVGLDPDEVLRLYQHEVPAATVEQVAEPIPVRAPRRVKSQSSERLGKIGFNIMMWSFLILIVVVVWVYFINQDADPPKQADQGTNITDASSPPPADEETDEPAGSGATPPEVSPTPPVPTMAPTTVTFGSKVGKADQYDIGPAGPHKLEIKVVGGKSWLEVREGSNSGNKLFSKNAEDGTVQSYDLTGPLYINVGRSDLTEITVDGVPVPDGDRAGSKKLLLHPVQEEAPAGEGQAEDGETGGTEGNAAAQ
ncbi:helix-turn-helix domain-containing protein [Paenibacillus arenilitoris]|uniref:Helix-turn-helix domain-containing protein n=1 Tax=Paenibacillus arenilitoris TaxID=2772299 RepID=A0A927CS84_9BACL|nr:RodZ family helix-turn-helix domain-containing protein [Paenibacillus arenilitoris]MBD2870670.1 helix-turn-helix domain-containing protein [Paenibacillus arenilitoris]